MYRTAAAQCAWIAASPCPLAAACPSRGLRFEPARKQGPFEGSFRQRRSTTLRVLDIVLDTQNYAIALPKGSPLRAMLNAPLLEETESDWRQQTLFQYLGKRQSP